MDACDFSLVLNSLSVLVALVRLSDTLLRIDWRSAWIPSSSASLSSHTGARGLGRRREGREGREGRGGGEELGKEEGE